MTVKSIWCYSLCLGAKLTWSQNLGEMVLQFVRGAALEKSFLACFQPAGCFCLLRPVQDTQFQIVAIGMLLWTLKKLISC